MTQLILAGNDRMSVPDSVWRARRNERCKAQDALDYHRMHEQSYAGIRPPALCPIRQAYLKALEAKAQRLA